MSNQHWTDFAPANPIKEATICNDGVSLETYQAQAPGVTRGHKDYIMGGGDIAEFDHCPHRWIAGYKDEATKSTDWGTIVDCLLMDGNQDRFAICPETYQNEKGEEKPWNFNAGVCKAWRDDAEAKGKQVVKPDLFQSAFVAAEIVLKDPQLMDLFKSSRKQVMIVGFYEDKATKIRVPVRCLIDLVPPKGFIADFKTCNSAHPRAWAKHVFQFGYHIQAARHLDLWNTATGEQRVDFRHYIQESFAPWEMGKRILSEEFILLGRDRYSRALARYAQCLATNEWPGYDVSSSSADLVIDGHLVVQPEPWMVNA